MQLTKTHIILVASLGLLLLGACSSGNQANEPTASPTTNQPIATDSASPMTKSDAMKPDEHSHGGQGGQVIESGFYHLELIIGKEANGTHIDFFLQKGDNHEPIPDAKVTAQVQLPDGSQKTLNMKYNAEDKHYTGLLPGSATGEYKVVILSDIGGEKVNGRFTFTR
ncbi:hypothetical protein GlitD10_2057 [Gloeomargarita lithophora Alchichica-D10]|uniref:YtkA-like domain-containing protein n=1 Tax=Gloeomargarita lithophora Alchichica-D10 TaxID=1188229 RepID=A0A1J0AEP3_9CYAN|nr:hypothetical protein [Gloeomargarita lithophora]APB34383.1 hypothetical protein GlitD10_2057 [Gloeomargarita lithophora Alchichica-D10]